MITRFKHRAELLGGERAERRSRTEGFCQRHDIGFNTGELLVAEQRPDSTHAGLDLVEHEQDVLLVAKVHDVLQVVGARNVHTALALYGFKQHGTGPAFDVCALNCFHVVVMNVHESRHQGLPVFLVRRLPGRGHHRLSASVKRIEGRDDLVSSVEFDFTPLAGDLAGTLVGFCARVAEKDAIDRRIVDNDLRQR